MSKRFSLLMLLLAVMMLAACGGEEPTPTPEPPTETPVPPTETPVPPTETPVPPTATPEPPTPTATPSLEVNTLEEVQQAVVQIVAQGTFIDPTEGLQYNAAGSGSGFIISEDGIAVTNNHVVTGAALLQVYVAGETEPRNARVLGVSECSDLAVIDIDGEGFRYLNWFEGDANVGLDIYAAGFPLGDPEFTLTRGIVSKANADGETGWASIDSVLEHDATINPGNSGGPLVTGDGAVVGVNYAGNSGTGQFFAIGRDVALPIIAELEAGNDVNSIGINGQVFYGDEGQGLGIWVASVATGSPASNADIEPGDILSSMEGLLLATDGTMSDYCDILRSNEPEDTLSIEVFRFVNGELQLLEGELNGDALETVVEVPTPEAPGTSVDYTYAEISDDSGRLFVSVPTQWGDINGTEWIVDGEVVGTAIRVAPNLDDFYAGWEVPGLFFGASASLTEQYDTIEAVLDDYSFANSCTYGSREPYEDQFYTGGYDLWTDCGGEGGSILVNMVATEVDQSVNLILIQLVVTSEAEVEAFEQIRDSFFVVNE